MRKDIGLYRIHVYTTVCNIHVPILLGEVDRAIAQYSVLRDARTAHDVIYLSEFLLFYRT